METTSESSGRLANLSGEPAAALFVYGTLRFPDVLRTLLDRVPSNTPAAVSGWRVAALRERVYPALIPAKSTADGLLLTGLSRAEWSTLDAFEDDLYDLRRLTLTNSDHAWAYVTDDHPAVLPDDWDPGAFSRDDLVAYLERCHRWRKRYEQTPRP